MIPFFPPSTMRKSRPVIRFSRSAITFAVSFVRPVAFSGREITGLFARLNEPSPPRKQTVSIPVISVEDWPDMKKRCIAFYCAGVLGKGAKPAEDRGIDALLNWLEKYVADSKQNWAVMDLSCSAQIKSRPDLIRQYTNEDLIKLGNWCRERFIEPIPRRQFGIPTA